jgi:hypothetical protein
VVGFARADLLEPEDVVPRISEVVEIAQVVSRLREHLVQAYIALRRTDLALVDLAVGEQAVVVAGGRELVQVRVRPAHACLEDPVHGAEVESTVELEPPPDWRLAVDEGDEDDVRRRVSASGSGASAPTSDGAVPRT